MLPLRCCLLPAARATKRADSAEGRILVDVARNTYGQTIVAAYAVRELPGAPVSAPVTWDEVADASLVPQAFTLRGMGERLTAMGDPWADIDEHAGTLAKALTMS